MKSYNQNYFEKLVLEIENAELGNLFGKPCGKLNKKAFVSFFGDEMVLKIGKEKVQDILAKYSGSKKLGPTWQKQSHE